MERMHFQEDTVSRTDQQKRKREERYARRTRQRTKEKEDTRNASKPPIIGTHTIKTNHQRSQSKGGNSSKTYKEDEEINNEHLAQKESESEDDLIIGTPLGTYVLRTKDTRGNTGTHTPLDKAQDETHQGNTANENLVNQRSWEKLKRNFEEQFSYKDSGFSGGSAQNNTDQEVKKPISQEEFDKLRRKFEERLKQFQNLGINTRVSPPPHNNNNPVGVGNNPPNSANLAAQHEEQRFPYQPIKVRLILTFTCKKLTMFVLPTRKTQMQSSCNYFQLP